MFELWCEWGSSLLSNRCLGCHVMLIPLEGAPLRDILQNGFEGNLLVYDGTICLLRYV